MSRPYKQLKIQEILSLCKQSIHQSETLYELRREVSFRKDSSKRTAYDLIDIAIRLNEDLSQRNASVRQFNPERLTLNEAYEALGVHPDTSTEEIVSVRRKLLQLYHPDKVATYAEKYRLLAENETKVINCAYRLIIRQRTTN